MRLPVALVVLLACLAGPVTASAVRYVVGVEDLDYLPHYTVQDGEYHGYGREVLDAFAAAEGIEFEYRPLPVTRLFVALAAGDIDLKYPDSPDWNPAAKRGVAVRYSDAVAPYVDGVMVRPEHVGEGAAHLRRLGTVQGFTPSAWLDRIAAGTVSLQQNPSLEGLLRQALGERVDGVYVNAAVGRHLLRGRLSREGGLVFDPSLPHVRNDYLLSSANHPELIDRFNRWLAGNRDWVAARQREWGIVDD